MSARLICFLLLAVAFLAAAQPSGNLTYGQLGAAQILPEWQNVGVYLPWLNSSSKPGSVKPMRKSLLYCRNGLDIFAYAFPIVKPPSMTLKEASDLFLALRDDLNVGYTLVGNFQDLSGVPYTHKDYKERLDPCLKWKTDFLAHWKRDNYDAYVHNISATALYTRPKSELSKDFWRHVAGEPTETLSGLANVAYLCAGQLADAASDYATMHALEDIWETKYHTLFHDYRKLLRAISFVGETYPAIWLTGVKPTQFATIDKAYDTFGNVNDLVAEYTYYKGKGDKKEEAKKKEAIVKAWKALRQWLDSVDFKAMLGQLDADLIPHSP